jgi:hypothetical protein
MMIALDLIIGALCLVAAGAYLWVWLRRVGDLVWVLAFRPLLSASTLLILFVLLSLVIAPLFGFGMWTTLAIIITLLPILGLWTINIVAWIIAWRSFVLGGRFAVITSQPNTDRPLARLPDLIGVRASKALRRSPWWRSFRRAVWAAPQFAILQRQTELAAFYERPQVEDGSDSRRIEA